MRERLPFGQRCMLIKAGGRAKTPEEFREQLPLSAKMLDKSAFAIMI